jgi:hypothetical protein
MRRWANAAGVWKVPRKRLDFERFELSTKAELSLWRRISPSIHRSFIFAAATVTICG